MKRTMQKIFSALGYEVHELSLSAPCRRLKMMQRLGIDFVLDVGANLGEYSAGLRRSGYKGRIWSYEPLHEAFGLLEKAASSDELWRAINCGCGSTAGSASINVAKNSESSSLLPMLAAHLASGPESEYIAQETISVCTLDESVIPSLGPGDNLWLKIDAQGYEAEVLKGAARLMPRVMALEVELSLVPLYQGQLLIGDMIAMLYQMGFRMVGVTPKPVFCEPETGYSLQIDGTFVKA
jgi:FkbM family methyltransferase